MSSSCIATCVFFACCFRAVRPEFGRRPPRRRRVLAAPAARPKPPLPCRRAATRGDAAAPPLRRRGSGCTASACPLDGVEATRTSISAPRARRRRVRSSEATSSLAPVAAPGAGRAARPRGGRRRPAAVAAATGRGLPRCRPVGGAPAAPAAPRRRGRGAASPGGSGPRRARSPCGGAPVCVTSLPSLDVLSSGVRSTTRRYGDRLSLVGVGRAGCARRTAASRVCRPPRLGAASRAAPPMASADS